MHGCSWVILCLGLLERTGWRLGDLDLIEIHEAFAAQVLAKVAAWERGWKAGRAIGQVDWERVNVSGSSVAVGHPWAQRAGGYSRPGL